MAFLEPRPVVLVAIDWYLPAYKAGGPIRSIANVIATLGDDIDFRIVCGDRDLGTNTPLPVELNQWQSTDKAQILFLPQSNWTQARWSEILREIQPDRLYLNSLYSGPFSRLPWKVARSMGIPTTLAPRGMLGAGALSVKPIRKKAWLWMQTLTGNYRDIRWHASTQQEAQEIKAWFPSANISVALNLPVPFDPIPIHRESDLIRILSVGRIHPIKNYGFGLDVAASLAANGNRVQYRIVGPMESPNEREKLENRETPVELEFTGPVPPTEIRNHIGWADLVLVPSFNENFGHSVAEAVAAARPVIVSDQTAWSSMDHGTSVRCLPLEISSWQQSAEELLAIDQEELMKSARDTHNRCLLDAARLLDQKMLFQT